MENLSSLIKEGHSSHCFAVTDDQLDVLVCTCDITDIAAVTLFYYRLQN